MKQALRVCWENRTVAGNCSSCEKCLRTMTAISGVGQVEHFSTFDHSQPLGDRIDQLPGIARLERAWQRRLEFNLPSPIRAAVERFVRRCRRRAIWRNLPLRTLQVRRSIGNHMADLAQRL